MARFKQIGIDVDVNGVIERNRRTFSESENDILRRILIPQPKPSADAAARAIPVADKAPSPTRSRGLWTVEISGQRASAMNLKEAYRTLLLALSDKFPDFLRDFSQEKGRSRRFVARSPDQLYLATPDLAKDYGKPLKEGWFFDTNLSTEQVSKRARVAARLCGLRYGQDVRLMNNFEEI